MKLTINGKAHTVDADPEMPLLWVMRDKLDIIGPKFGCGMAQCGACTVLVDGEPTRSCVTPASSVSGKITTIEGIAASRLESACRRHGLIWTSRNAAIARRGRLSRQPLCCNPNPSRPMLTLTKPWRATSAAVRPISASAPRLSKPPGSHLRPRREHKP